MIYTLKKVNNTIKITIYYDGKYPNLCSGELIVILNDTPWEFGSHSLVSGGSVWFDDDWNDHVTSGEWTIDSWPKDFPEEYKIQTLGAVNSQIGWGCCGGCV